MNRIAVAIAKHVLNTGQIGGHLTLEEGINSVIAWQSFHCGTRQCPCTAQENCYLQRNLMPNKECGEELNQSISLIHSCQSYNGVEEDKNIFQRPYVCFLFKM